MSSLLVKDKRILEATKHFDRERKNLREVIKKVQEDCTHPIVITAVARDYDDLRICPMCGIEEQAPPYHSFYFKHLEQTQDRLFIEVKSTDDFYKFRDNETRPIFYGRDNT